MHNTMQRPFHVGRGLPLNHPIVAVMKHGIHEWQWFEIAWLVSINSAPRISRLADAIKAAGLPVFLRYGSLKTALLILAFVRSANSIATPWVPHGFCAHGAPMVCLVPTRHHFIR